MRVADTIHEKLTAAFAPQALEVADESPRHAGHSGPRATTAAMAKPISMSVW